MIEIPPLVAQQNIYWLVLGWKELAPLRYIIQVQTRHLAEPLTRYIYVDPVATVEMTRGVALDIYRFISDEDPV